MMNDNEGEDPGKMMREFGRQWCEYFSGVERVMTECEQLRQRVAELEERCALQQEALDQQKRSDEWSSRVTYENVIDLIASNEDAAMRDQARRFIEPMLKQPMVKQMRKDIKRRVKELNEEAMNDSEGGVVPKALKSEEAVELMTLLVEAGLLNGDWQPMGLSGSERALVAKAVCDRVGINEVWQVFGRLWNEKPETLRSYLNKALDQKKSLEYQEKLKDILD